jgi:hypothetical protein
VIASIYLDDLLALIRAAQDGDALALAILAAYAALGLQVKFKKSVITPTTLIRHLGLDLDVCNRRILPPPDKIKRMSTLVKRLLSSSARQRRFVSKLYLAKVVGFA